MLIYNNFNKYYYGESLNPEAKILLEKDLFKEEDYTKNGFYYLMGMNCLKNEDPFEIGYNYVLSKRQKTIDQKKEFENLISGITHDEELPNQSQEFTNSFSYDDFNINREINNFDFFESKVKSKFVCKFLILDFTQYS